VIQTAEGRAQLRQVLEAAEEAAEPDPVARDHDVLGIDPIGSLRCVSTYKHGPGIPAVRCCRESGHVGRHRDEDSDGAVEW
jgi:hypothetical protein